MTGREPLTVGSWRVEPDVGRILRDSSEIALRRQVMDLLVYLVAHKDEASRKASFDGFRQDPAWKAAREASEKDGPILGATVAAQNAGEMIHELMYSVAWEALPSEAAAFIHAHPTVSEAIGETLLSAAGRSLH